MKKRRGRFWVISGIVCLCAMFTIALAEPGTEGDPLISKAYIDNVLMPKIENLIESKLEDVSFSEGSTSDASVFNVVNVKAGKKVICKAGTELILRSGKATVIATEKGGLADTTAGVDIANGNSMPSNHLLVVPVADGRGLDAETDVIVMIKGGYSIKSR